MSGIRRSGSVVGQPNILIIMVDQLNGMLFDLASDPYEMQNLANDPAYAIKMAHFTTLLNARWDLERFDAEVRESQARRHIVYAALRQGHYYPWDYQPLQLAS